MLIFISWFALAVRVGIVANSRGRSGFGFFILAVFLSPLVGIIFAVAMPNLRQQALLERLASSTRSVPPPLPIGHTRTTVRREPKAFEPDGVFTGIPYRVADDGSIEAIMQGAMVRFVDYDKFIAANGGER